MEEYYQSRVEALEKQNQELINTIEEYKAELLRTHMDRQAAE